MFTFVCSFIQRSIIDPDEGKPRRPVRYLISYRCGRELYNLVKGPLRAMGIDDVEFESIESAEQSARNYDNHPMGLNFSVFDDKK